MTFLIFLGGVGVGLVIGLLVTVWVGRKGVKLPG